MKIKNRNLKIKKTYSGGKMKTKTKENIETGIDFVIENGGEIIGGLLEDTICSIGVPVISNAIVLYKQKRFERNIKEMMTQINIRVSEFEKILNAFSNEQLTNFKNTTLPNTMDYIVDEKQTSKIKYYVNSMLIMLKKVYEDSDFDKESFELSIFTLLSQMTLTDLNAFLEIGEQFYYIEKELEIEAIHLTQKPDIQIINKKNSQIKLTNLGLILTPTLLGEIEGSGQFLHQPINCKLTYLGEELYSYIKED